MTQWFQDHVPNFNMENAVWHPKDSGPIYDWNKLWRDPDLEQHLKSSDDYKDLPIGKIKGMKRYFTWFTDDADIFVSSVGNDGHTWFTESDEYKKNTFKDMIRNYGEAISRYYPQKDGQLPVPTFPSQEQAAEGIQERQRKVPFGPWLFWSKTEWDEIDRQWSLHCRQKLRSQPISTTNTPNVTTQTPQKHTQTQSEHQQTDTQQQKSHTKSKRKSRRDKSKKQRHHRNQSKSRSRSRSRSREKHRSSHNHHSKKSNQSPSSPIHSDNPQVSS